MSYKTLLVKDLIEILKNSPQEMPIATEAMGHIHASKCHNFSHGGIGVSVLSTHEGPHVLIGGKDMRNDSNFQTKRIIYDPWKGVERPWK